MSVKLKHSDGQTCSKVLTSTLQSQTQGKTLMRSLHLFRNLQGTNQTGGGDIFSSVMNTFIYLICE